MLLRPADKHVTEDGALEIIFEVGKPMGCAHHRRALANNRIGKAHAILRGAILDVLLHAVPSAMIWLSSDCSGGIWVGSGHFVAQSRCPLWANSGHRAIHSITSSARASSVGGTVSPSAWAVLRLMINSNRVGCSTGRSAGLAPFKLLSI